MVMIKLTMPECGRGVKRDAPDIGPDTDRRAQPRCEIVNDFKIVTAARRLLHKAQEGMRGHVRTGRRTGEQNRRAEPDDGGLTVTDWPISERPRERILSEGAAALSDADLLAVVIGSSSRGSGGILATCRGLLRRFGGLEGVLRCRAGELMQVSGIGEARAGALMAVAELARRRAGQPALRGDSLTRSAQVYQRVRRRLVGLTYEVFIVVALDARNRLLSLSQIAQGSATSVQVHPREVFTPLLRESACAAIVAHNHPSGDPEPSEDDRLLTCRLIEAGHLLGIPLLDHLIVGGAGYVSLADRGLIVR